MLKLIGLLVPLSLDSFAVAATLGVAGLPPNRRLRVSLLFTAFEAVMPLVGLLIGEALGKKLGVYTHFAAIIVLAVFGVLTLLSGGKKEEAELVDTEKLSKLASWAAIGLGISISI